MGRQQLTVDKAPAAWEKLAEILAAALAERGHLITISFSVAGGLPWKLDRSDREDPARLET
jgi:hypothetical protein